MEAEVALQLEEQAAAVSEGIAKTIESDVARIAQQKSGSRSSDIPGARSLKIVTMKLIAPAVVEIAEEDEPDP